MASMYGSEGKNYYLRQLLDDEKSRVRGLRLKVKGLQTEIGWADAVVRNAEAKYQRLRDVVRDDVIDMFDHHEREQTKMPTAAERPDPPEADDLREELQLARSNLRELEETCTFLGEEAATLRGEVANLRRETGVLRRGRKSLQAVTATDAEEAEEAETLRRELEEMTAIRERLKATEDERDRWIGWRDHWYQKWLCTNKELYEAKKAADDWKQEVAELHRKLQEAKAVTAQGPSEYHKLREEVETLRRQRDFLRGEMAEQRYTLMRLHKRAVKAIEETNQ